MACASCGGSAKPLSASSIAGWNRSAHGSRPSRRCASSSTRSTPGTPTDRPLSAASMKSTGLPSASRNRSGRAFFGAVSRPSSALSLRVTPSQCSRNAPPPMPEDCGSTRPSTAWAAIAASTALPPWRRIARAASDAAGSAVATMKWRPVASAAPAGPLSVRIGSGGVEQAASRPPNIRARAPQPGSARRTRRSSVMLGNEPNRRAFLAAFGGRGEGGRSPQFLLCTAAIRWKMAPLRMIRRSWA